MISSTNGCACCAVSGDLTNKLIEIAERDDPPDAIVLEASGVADPHGIAMEALTNPAIRLDGSLVVVDAETRQDLAEDSLNQRLFHNQVSAASKRASSQTSASWKKTPWKSTSSASRTSRSGARCSGVRSLCRKTNNCRRKTR